MQASIQVRLLNMITLQHIMSRVMITTEKTKNLPPCEVYKPRPEIHDQYSASNSFANTYRIGGTNGVLNPFSFSSNCLRTSQKNLPPCEVYKPRPEIHYQYSASNSFVNTYRIRDTNKGLKPFSIKELLEATKNGPRTVTPPDKAGRFADHAGHLIRRLAMFKELSRFIWVSAHRLRKVVYVPLARGGKEGFSTLKNDNQKPAFAGFGAGSQPVQVSGLSANVASLASTTLPVKSNFSSPLRSGRAGICTQGTMADKPDPTLSHAHFKGQYSMSLYTKSSAKVECINSWPRMYSNITKPVNVSVTKF